MSRFTPRLAERLDEELGYCVRYWHSPERCTYLLVEGKFERARSEYERMCKTFKRVELLELNIKVLKRSDG